MKTTRLFAFGFMATVLILGSACLIGSDRERTLRAGQLDFKLGPFTYLEEGKLVGLAVGTEAARYREKEIYIPLWVGLANKGAGTLNISRESFILQDENGRRYPLATIPEIASGYGPTTLDRKMTTFRDIFNAHFVNFEKVPSDFFPDRVGGGLVNDTIEIPRWRDMMDILYFPKPEGGVVGHRFELHVTSPGLKDGVFVKFLID